METLERQNATKFDDIRPDHLERYNFALSLLKKRNKTNQVMDVGAGIGYGSNILSQGCQIITSIEIDKSAYITFQKNFNADNINYFNEDITKFDFSKFKGIDAAVCFEFIEHVPEVEAKKIINQLCSVCDTIIFSTPNEDVRPHKQPPVNEYHFKHYTPVEMENIFKENGFKVNKWWNQKSGKVYQINDGTNGKFIIGIATKE